MEINLNLLMVLEYNFLLERTFGSMELFKGNTRHNNTFTFSHLFKASQPSFLCYTARQINELPKRTAQKNSSHHNESNSSERSNENLQIYATTTCTELKVDGLFILIKPTVRTLKIKIKLVSLFVYIDRITRCKCIFLIRSTYFLIINFSSGYCQPSRFG